MNFLAFVFAFLFVISTATEAKVPVLDWNGKPLKTGVAYEMWGVGRGRGPIAIGRSTSTVPSRSYVVNKPYRTVNPFIPDPVIFFPANTSEHEVYVGSRYNIVFKVHPLRAWRTNITVGSADTNFITTGGRRGDLQCSNVVTWFQLAPVNVTAYLYKLVSNPHVCDRRFIPQAETTSVLKEKEDRLYLNIYHQLPNPAVQLRLGRRSASIRNFVEMMTLDI